MVTHKAMKEKFERVFQDILKLPITANFNAETREYSRAFYILEFAPQYGGYRISLVAKKTSHHTVFTAGRMSAKEMKRFLDGLEYSKRIKQEFKEHKLGEIR